MPFKSRKQQDFLRINEPEIYNRWMRLYGPYEGDAETWQGISLAGKVDEISEMLDTRKKKAEGDPTWMRDPEQKRKVFLKLQKQDGVPRICEVCEDTYTGLYYYTEDDETFVVCRPCVQRSEKEWGEMFGIKPDWTGERGGRTRTAIMEADESKWIVSSDDIQVGDKVRSYDFVLSAFGDEKAKTLQSDSYVEGYVMKIAPVPESYSPETPRYHIRATARVLGGQPKGDYEDYYYPVAHPRTTVVRRLRRMNAENWGGDPDGQLAQALAKARAKSTEPRRPLKITKLPHRDQKTLKDFEAPPQAEEKVFTKKDIGLVIFGATLGVVSGVVGEVLAEFWLDRYRRDPELVVSEEKENA